MADLEKACEIYTSQTGTDVIMDIIDMGDGYLIDGTFVNTETGEMKDLLTAMQFFDLEKGRRIQDLYVPWIFDKFRMAYEKDNSENYLVSSYVSAWNNLVWLKECDEKFFSKDKTIREKLVSEWTKIEQDLYGKLINIIDTEKLEYPPCCLAHMNDFYRLKPIMLRNGYADDMWGRYWERMRES